MNFLFGKKSKKSSKKSSDDSGISNKRTDSLINDMKLLNLKKKKHKKEDKIENVMVYDKDPGSDSMYQTFEIFRVQLP
jgi:hypothetical protein